MTISKAYILIYEAEIQWVFDQHRNRNVLYDDYIPYEFHLKVAGNIMQKFAHLIKYDYDIPYVYLAVIGHDLIEETGNSYNDVRKKLGEIAANVIYAVTNEKGKNRKERANSKYYEGIRSTPYNTPLKPQLHKHIVISRFYLWFIRTFKVISNQRAKELGLSHWRNVYGDEINHINCRSIWFDNKSRKYRVSHLEDVC